MCEGCARVMKGEGCARGVEGEGCGGVCVKVKGACVQGSAAHYHCTLNSES